MKVAINLPKGGMGIDEATVTTWLKQVGDRVSKGETVVEVETAKAAQDVEAPASGILVEVLAAEGDEVTVNSALGYIDDGA
jgi:pyruvate/2-oxoglutarate dehydrogenase complex dihydrolipoamide acyltransferase (E2) component